MLKNRLRNLKPVSKEDHEVMIELHDEVEYLKEQLEDLGSGDLLHRERDYLSSVYRLMPDKV